MTRRKDFEPSICATPTSQRTVLGGSLATVISVSDLSIIMSLPVSAASPSAPSCAQASFYLRHGGHCLCQQHAIARLADPLINVRVKMLIWTTG